MWASVSSTVTGLKVPAPTASVRSAISTPRSRSAPRISLGEVEAGRRSRDRERLPREDGLVGRAVLGPIRGAGLAPDVGRKGSAADAVEERRVERAVEVARSRPPSSRTSTTSAERPSSNPMRAARLRSAAGLRERAPEAGAGCPAARAGRSRRGAPPNRARRGAPGGRPTSLRTRRSPARRRPGSSSEAPMRDRARCPVEHGAAGSCPGAAPPGRSAPPAARSRRGRRARAVAYATFRARVTGGNGGRRQAAATCAPAMRRKHSWRQGFSCGAASLVRRLHWRARDRRNTVK